MNSMEEFAKGVWSILLEYWFLIASVFAAYSMAVFRTAKDNGKVDWIEAFMCAIFTYGVWFVLGWLNLPEGAGVLIGSFIGWVGSHKMSRFIASKLDFDMEQEQKDKDKKDVE